ncbi:MAG: TolC family protein, partial [Alphaproteobacteria bacterium]|nr:TolC family protein [Alphaproteobacteria bacterium]
MKNLLRTSSIMVLALTMAGCATDPPAALELSSLNLPSMFTAPVAKEAPIWPKADWWKGFGSTEMDGLIDTAQKNNLDLDAAIARVRQAEAQTEISGSVLFPDVTVSADVSRQGTKVHGVGL